MTTPKFLPTLLTFILLSFSAFAQETTSTLNGTVNDEKGNPIPGATIAVTHVPTGITSTTQTNKKGLYTLPNLKPGGPYAVKISFVGYSEQSFDNLNFILENNPDLNID